MGSNSAIEWTDTTWNPLAGCTRASAGCDHCYAATLSLRLERMGQAKYTGIATKLPNGHAAFNGTINFDYEALNLPLTWKKPRMVFVNSMSDLFHKDVPDAFIDQVFAVMKLASSHTFQVLTKRPERMAAYFAAEDCQDRVFRVMGDMIADGVLWKTGTRQDRRPKERPNYGSTWPLPNVWLGTSVENQEAANRRIPHLLSTPAAVRFLSCEPLLGPVDLGQWVFDRQKALDHMIYGPAAMNEYQADAYVSKLGIHQVIVGGESGKGFRRMDPQWPRDIRDQCVAAGVAFFFKQWGGFTPKAAGRILDGRTWDELPQIVHLVEQQARAEQEDV